MIPLPRESSEFIVKNADYVKVHEDKLNPLKTEIIQNLKEKVISVRNFSQCEHHPKSDEKDAPNWIFLIDTLNFCFWTPQIAYKYKVSGQTGYFSLCAAVNRALKDGIQITDPNFYKNIDKEQLSHIFRSDDGITQMPLIDERLSCLHEVGKILIEKFQGNFANCIRLANGSAKKLLQIITENFPCFRDVADYKGETVSFYKRAQILIGDIWSYYCGEGDLGKFHDIDEITAFADYRVPQVLVYHGILEYTKELQDILASPKILSNGDPMEIEIRGATIYAIEKLKEQIQNEIKSNPDKYDDKIQINSILIDHYLWDWRRKNAKKVESIPFHKVLSVYY